MVKKYTNELEGQYNFYTNYLPLIDKNLEIDDILIENTDGQIGDMLIEMKLNISNLNEVVFQAVKYLSKLRIKGIPVPGHFMLLDLNSEKAYLYESEKFRDSIEKVYLGGASRSNHGFTASEPINKWDYSNNNKFEQAAFIQSLKAAHKRKNNGEGFWFPINIDVNNIVGWATTYYQWKKNATKASFLGDKGIIGEIRKPEVLKGLILPYLEVTNIKFGYLMDRLNDNFLKKDLGAFFTPSLYANLSHNLVYEAIRRHQKSGNKDYIILDRCAGTGNLELDLNNNVPDDIIDKDILSHVILNTYEYYEYKVLLERLGDKVRYIIPPIENEDTFMSGKVRGSNALSAEFINNSYLQSFIQDQNVTIIIFENPPYTESTSIQHQKAGKGKTSSAWKQDKGTVEAKKVLKGAQSNELANIFLWTAIEYYLKKPEDSLIAFSPVKYWKNGDWMNKKFIKGFAMNRRHFHTKSDTAISCILWANEDVQNQNELNLEAWDIIDNKLENIKNNVLVRRVFLKYSETYYDKRTFPNDTLELKNYRPSFSSDPNAVWCEYNGTEYLRNKDKRLDAIYNKNIIGYMIGKSVTFENPRLKTTIVRNATYDGNGFFLRSDNFFEKLPMFAAGWWSTYNNDWTLDGIIYRSGDGVNKFQEDLSRNKLNEWLCKVLFYTCLEYYNKIRCFNGTDGRTYLNELSLDITLHETLAFRYLHENNFFKNLNDDEIILVELWQTILQEAKETKNYNDSWNYSPFQIENELNTKHKVTINYKEKTVYDYPSLNGNLKSLRKLIKNYYHKYIVNYLFEYEFLK